MQLQQILDAVDNALTVVKTIADTPGVNLIPYVSTISSFIGVAQAITGAGRDVGPLIQKFTDTFSSGSAPTEADMAALDADIAAEEAKLQAPLPPPDAGEPD